MTDKSDWKLWIRKHPRLFSAIVGVVVVGLALGAWAYGGWVSYQMQNEAMLKTVADGIDKEDLRAQQDMAEFAYGLLLWAAFGFAASIAGVAFVAFTINQNRRMIEATREIGQNQCKAYIAPSHGEVSIGETPRRLRLLIQVRNLGETPALQVTALGRMLTTLPDGTPRVDELDLTITSMVAPFDPDPEGRIDYVECRLSAAALESLMEPFRNASKLQFPAVPFQIFGLIRYRDVFGDTYESDFIGVGAIPSPASVNRRLQIEPGHRMFKRSPAP